MKTLVNLFHPHLDKSTVHRSWAQRLAQEADITLRDLYALYPDGKIDVAAEQAALLAHDRLVFEHPFYWYSTPPLMKQWLDDVLTYGWGWSLSKTPERANVRGLGRLRRCNVWQGSPHCLRVAPCIPHQSASLRLAPES